MRFIAPLLLRRSALGISLSVLLILLGARNLVAQWTPLGPEGGDVRSLAEDPRYPERIFLGTSAGQIFLSSDNGMSWNRFAHLGEGDDYVLDNIEVDPNSGDIYVGAWTSGRTGGDLFRSRNGGRTWAILPGMRGKSIRALAMAPSNPRILIVGALDGVYRSRDGGGSWEQISPSDERQFRNVESVAIDPQDPQIIYVGTWHLGWKTADGGETWRPMKNGVVDDSDVFSITIDYNDSRNIYLSTCSGIYKSEYSAELFHKLNGIPYAARRSRVLKQDPANPLVLYAGTTDGLWRSDDAGDSWRALLADVTVNDVHIDPRDPRRVLLATDRGGVLLSTDGGVTFTPSNHGFSHRSVASVLVDAEDSQTIYVGVLNDKEFGGVLVSRDRGKNWRQLNTGIENLDVFSLAQAENGDLLAGTSNGIYKLARESSEWQPAGTVFLQNSAPAEKSQPDFPTRLPLWTKIRLQARVMQLEIAPRRWYAATAMGLYGSRDQGRSWQGGFLLGHKDFRTVHVSNSTVLATTSQAALLSSDGGWNWTELQLPAFVGTVYGATVGPGNVLWLATHQGALRSSDAGATWELVAPHLLYHVTALVYDEEGHRLLAIARAGGLFSSTDGGKSWRIEHTGFPLRSIAAVRGHLFAATTFNGVIAQAAAIADAPVTATGK